MAQTPYLIKLEDVTVEFRQRQALQHVSMAVGAGEITTIIGPNGAGKTTLVRVLLGIQAPTSGKVHRPEACRIGYMPQKLAIEQTMPLSVQRFLTFEKSSDEAHWQEIVSLLKIEAILTRMMHQLSGGETQRVLLARALLRKPNLLILDEPAQGLDMLGQVEFYNIIGQIREQLGCGVVMISHDLHLVMSKTDHVICLHKHICCQGHPDDVSKDPHFQALFGALSTDNLALYTHHHDHHHDLAGEVVQDEEAK